MLAVLAHRELVSEGGFAVNRIFTLWLSLVTVFLAVSIDRLEKRGESTRRWVENLQAVLYVTSVQAPCVKCGNPVFNTSQFWSDGPCTHRTRCAHCGEPDPESLRVTKAWWASNSWKWEKK